MRNDSLVILSLCLEVTLKASFWSLSDKFWRLLKAGDIIPLADFAVTGNNVNPYARIVFSDCSLGYLS